ncbi:MAG: HD-GYP domain-containing protein [Planctomycetaceae bacterium]|nr:HD-GYP domain-containing protein [Planctomycetaceae bacterium]
MPIVQAGPAALPLLSETFGVPFYLGTRHQNSLSVPFLDGIRELAPALSALGHRCRRAVIPTGDGRLLVAVPFPNELHLLAIGIFHSTDARLVDQLAAGAERLLEQQLTLQRSEDNLNDCLEQLTFSMEEQSWLRSLSRQIESCTARQHLPDMAATILPRLCTLIGAESLAYLPPDIADRPATAASDVRWTGAKQLSVGQCRRFLAAYGLRAVERAVVAQESDSPELFRSLGLRSVILVSIAQRNGVGGWLFAANRCASIVPLERSLEKEAGADCEFGSIEAGLLDATATMLSSHVRTADALQQREDLIFRLMRTMSSAIDARDAYTRGHSQRVGRYAMEIGRQLALDRHECQQLFLTGLLHDLGKIGVPDHVLLKPGRLSPEEFALIKLHPEIGHRILQPIPELAFSLPGVLHHHERMDGQGYPHGLSGEEIPMMARILAAADAYDAMTSSRTYRAAMSENRAREILGDGAGSQWDRDVIAAFLNSPDLAAIADSVDSGPADLSAVSPSIFDDDDEDPRKWENPSMVFSSSLLETTEVML